MIQTEILKRDLYAHEFAHGADSFDVIFTEILNNRLVDIIQAGGKIISVNLAIGSPMGSFGLHAIYRSLIVWDDQKDLG